MKPIDWSRVPLEGPIPLITVRDLTDDARPMMADFRDHEVVLFTPARAMIGISRTGLVICRGTPEMRDGIWYAEADRDPRWKDVVLSAENVRMVPIA